MGGENVGHGKYPILFCTGGAGYMLLELLWRGWSHGSMFFAGGTCFLLLGRLSKMRMPLPLRALSASGVITCVELAVGLAVNRDYRVWDYRGMPLSLRGQICLPFSLLWIPVGLTAMTFYRHLDRRL